MPTKKTPLRPKCRHPGCNTRPVKGTLCAKHKGKRMVSRKVKRTVTKPKKKSG